MPNAADVFSILLFFALLALFICVIVKSYISLSKKSGEVINTCNATAVSKRAEVFEGKKKKDKTVYFITFETDDGELELRVSPNEYKEISVRDKGMLTYRSTAFLRFEIKSNSAEAE